MTKISAYFGLSLSGSALLLLISAVFARNTNLIVFGDLTLVLVLIYCVRPIVQCNALSMLAHTSIAGPAKDYLITRSVWLAMVAILSVFACIFLVFFNPFGLGFSDGFFLALLFLALAVNDLQGQEELLEMRQIAYAARLFFARLLQLILLLCMAELYVLNVSYYIFSALLAEIAIIVSRNIFCDHNIFTTLKGDCESLGVRGFAREGMKILKFGCLLAPATIAGIIINQVDRVVVSEFFDAASLALYGVAAIVGSGVNTLSGAAVSFVRARLLRPASEQSVIIQLRVMMALAIAITAMYPFISEILEIMVRSVYGDKFSGAGTISAFIALAYVWLGAYRLLTVNLERHNRPIARSVALAVAAILHIVVSVIFAMLGKVAGPAISMLAVCIALTLSMYVYQRSAAYLPGE